MFLTNHALTGAVIGMALPQPELAAPLAFASHFALDALPHYGDRRWGGFSAWRWRIMGAADFTLACAVTAALCYLRPHQAWHMLLGAFFACLPDLFYIPETLFGVRLDKTLRRFHSWIQWGESPLGIIVEPAWAVAMAGVLALGLGL